MLKDGKDEEDDALPRERKGKKSMTKSLNPLTAKNLNVGEKFVAITPEGTEIFGIVTDYPHFDIWYANLVTGLFEEISPTQEVEKLDTFLDLVIRLYKDDFEEQKISSPKDINEVMTFLGVDPSVMSQWDNWNKPKTEKE